MRIELLPASPDQQPILANLLELYAHDFSEFYDVHIGDDGKFGYASLPLYWSEPERHPFLVQLDGKWAGFALVKRTENTWDMAEFFILRRYRRLGIGTQVAHLVFRRFPGCWKVRVMEANASGQRFWAEAVSTFAGQPIASVPFESGGLHWSLFSFESFFA
jgi:predicted acetyltransferase